MNNSSSLYIDGNSFFHRLDGSVKMLLVVTWTIFIFMFMDLRIFMVMLLIGSLFLRISKLPWKSVRPLFWFIIVFTFFNSLMLILVSPGAGNISGVEPTPFISIGKYVITYETLFYALTLSFKYISLLPITILFLFTTHPSRFASSLNRLGVSYKIGYAINIALRYIPDVKNELFQIMDAQSARGVAFKRGDAPIGKLLKNYTNILLPMLISSLNRVEVVSNAMELRGFGKHKKRTWYTYKKFTIMDFLVVVSCIVLILVGLILKSSGFTNFWYPF